MTVRPLLLMLLLLAFVAGLAAAQNGTECPAGFRGTQCAICYTDAGCVDSTGNSEATCSNDINFKSNSQLKSYSCSLQDGLLSTLLVPGSLLVQCHTGLSGNQTLNETAPAPGTEGGNATDADAAGRAPSAMGRRRLLQQQQQQQQEQQPEGAFCDIGFRVADPAVGVQCRATECVMSANAPFAQCAAASCACPGGCNSPIIESLITSVSGPVSMDCKAGGACALKLTGLPLESIDATCDVGECLVPTDGELGNVTRTDPSNLNTNPIIAAIPSMVLALVLALLGTYALSNRRLWKYTISEVDAAELNRLASKAANAEPRLGSLEFQRLTVVVPAASEQQLRSRLGALRAKAMQGMAAGPGGTAAGRAPAASGSGSASGGLLEKARALALLGAPKDVEAAPTGGTEDVAKLKEAAAAADYVCQLQTGGQSPGQATQWYILKDLSFTARAGEVVGVIGPSGCGKTSLLGSVAGSAMDLGSTAVMTGAVLVDGHRRKKRDVAYVPQSDVLIPSLTVEESVRYSALLRLPEDTQPLDLQLRIERVLEELGLQHVAGSQVGGSGRIRGVSGGERRRVTIGMELVTDPAILILDEPTSGLDSYTAINLMRTLRKVAARGRVVMASLHQPSRDMFLSLDQVLLMAHGRVLYAGRPGDAEAWFARRGLPCPPGTDVAEHMLKVASSPPDIKHLLEQTQQQQEATAATVAAAEESGLVAVTPSPAPALAPHTSVPRSGAGGAGACAGAGAGSPHMPKQGLREDSSLSKDSAWSDKGACSDPDDSFSFAQPGAGAPQAQVQAQAPQGATEEEQRRQWGPAGQEAKQREHARASSLTESELSMTGDASRNAAPGAKRSRKPGVARQMAVLFWRSWVDIVRNPTLLRLHVLIAVVMGLLTGFVFWDLDLTNVGVQNRMGGTFFALAFFAFASLTTVDLLMTERAVVTREVRGGFYSPFVYLTSKLTLDGVLLRMVPAVLFWAPFYYMAGFKTGAAYAATYVFCLIAFSGALGAMSMAVTVAADTPGQASFLMNFLLLFSLIFTGFLVNVASIPAAIRWLHYLSIFYWAFEAMVSSEISGLVITFQAEGFGEIKGVMGETFLRTLGFNPGNITRNIWVLIGMYGAFCLLSMLLFLYKLPRTRHGHGRGWWRLGKAARASPVGQFGGASAPAQGPQ